MTGKFHTLQVSLAVLLSFAVGLGWASPAAAQDAEEEPGVSAPQSGITGPTPLITVRPGPAAPSGPPPGPPAELMPLPASFAEPVGPFTMLMEIVVAGGPSEYGLFAAPGCVPLGIFKRGMK